MGLLIAPVVAGVPNPGSSSGSVTLPSVEYSAILPGLLLVGGALLLLLVSSLFREKAGQAVYSLYTVLVAGVALLSTVAVWGNLNDASRPPGEGGISSAFAGSIANDHFSVFFAVTICSALILSTLVGGDWLSRHRIRGPEFHVLTMLSSAGAVFMAQANDLIVVFLGLEILSIALYVLAGFNKRSDRSREAALKYFLLGGFSSAVFLYGIALVYGATGTTNLSGISKFLSENLLVDQGLLLAGVALLIVGFGFKVAAVPFHQWTPDVYEGAPSPVTGFMAAVAKAAAFAAFIRVFMSTLYTLSFDWKPVLLAIAVLTLLVGSIVACFQTDVKRMLAYSSISHAGFILLGLQAANNDGVAGALYYLLTYSFIVVGSFAIITVVGGRNDDNHSIEAYRGLGHRNPTIALALTILLLAQAGVPLTSGFLAKFYVLSAQVENGSYATAMFAMLVAAIAAFFYLRLAVVMWGSDRSTADTEGSHKLALPPATWIATTIAVVFTVGLGVLPPDVIDAVTFAKQAAADLFVSASLENSGLQQ